MTRWGHATPFPLPSSSGSGGIPASCNEHYSDPCANIFHARAASFAVLSFLLLLHAYNCRDMRKSITHSGGLTSNRWLFGAVVIGLIAVLPTFYIPWINQDLLKARGSGGRLTRQLGRCAAK